MAGNSKKYLLQIDKSMSRYGESTDVSIYIDLRRISTHFIKRPKKSL